jgi:Holliday junction resolvase RusA-like endonuclease
MNTVLPPLSFEIPSPLSLNNCYADVIYRDAATKQLRARRVPTAELVAFKEAVGWIAKGAANQQGWVYQEGMQIELHILMFFKDRRRRDLSNRIKTAEDAIVKVLGFDDSWTTINRVIVESGGIDPRPRAIVTIRASLSSDHNNTAKEQKGHVRQSTKSSRTRRAA